MAFGTRPAAVGGVRGRLGRVLRRDRTSGYVAVGLAIVLGVVATVIGVGVPNVAAHLRQVTAWLGNSNGTATHVDGLSGKADARVTVHDAAGHKLRVLQSGAIVIVQDETTGVISRIDPSLLGVTTSASYGSTGDQVVVGDGLAYVVDESRGTVQRIDPAQLNAIGTPLGFGSAIGLPGIDTGGTLWVPVPANGAVIPVRIDASGAVAKGTPVTVGAASDQLGVTVVGGAVAVVDSTAGVVTVARDDGGTTKVNLPGGATPAATGVLLAPAATGGSVVPLLNPSSGILVLVDTASGAPTAVTLGELSGHRLGTPAENAGRVYIPDQSTGGLDVYDEAASRLVDRIQVPGATGPLDVFVKDGIVWANDPTGANALSIDADGTVHQVGKYNPGLAGGPTPKPTPSPSPSSTQGTAQLPTAAPYTPPVYTPEPTRPTGRPHRPQPSASASPSPSPTPPPKPSPSATAVPPLPPGSVSAKSYAGYINVAFAPSAGGTPTSYTLEAPAGATVMPSSITPGGHFLFTVTGLSCSTTQYTFIVDAVYSGGKVSSQPSAAVRPCLPPGAPTSPNTTVKEHEVDLSWTAGSSGGGNVTYDISCGGNGCTPQNNVAGTSAAFTGLVNQNSYSFGITAVNAAGQSTPPTNASATLNPPGYGTYEYNNSQLPVNIRAAANTGAKSLGSFPPTSGQGPGVTVICQVQGGQYSDPTAPNVFYDIWDMITSPGRSPGYVADMYIHTPQSANGAYGSFSDPPIWNCN